MVYSGKALKEISFPLGGIGTGSIGLAGNGELVDWEIFNRPNKGSINPYSFFAVKAEFADGRSVTKVLQGDHIKELTGVYSKKLYAGFGFGPDAATMCGFPHFKKVRFDGRFPIATLTFEDEQFPAKVVLKAFNPFIPLEADLSSIPAAFFEVQIKSRVEGVRYSVALSVSNPFGSSKNRLAKAGKYTAVQLQADQLPAKDTAYGDITIAVDAKETFYQEYWYRGGWQDKVTTFWREFSKGDLQNRHYTESAKNDVATVGACAVVGNGQSQKMRFVLSWNVPNCRNYWDKNPSDTGWKNYYATLYKHSVKSAVYSLRHWSSLYKKTNVFAKSLHTSSLEPCVIDAATATLSVLKSATVLRLEDGSFYGWEGLNEQEGSCRGTCTHVWSYAYALCFLFPELERSIRDVEFAYDTEADGKMHFRTELPLGESFSRTFPPCVDGQMATVVKIYRDWKLTGNTAWLQENWSNVKKILEYAWHEQNDCAWDKDKDGVLEGRQHHTLDMELFGPSAWLQGMYLAALKAAAEMALFLGDAEKAQEYTLLFEKGYAYTKENLFNGSYFYHKIDLKNKAYTEQFNCPKYWNEEKGELKYQIADGCEIDQLLGQWHANICGLGDIFDKTQRQTALKSMFKNNFKSPMRDFANMWRVFALNDESGTVMCDYPDGVQKPVIPIPYCEECMTGFEYAFAGLLLSEGFIKEGLQVVRAVRERYDGEKRNPWNEIECGSNYARAMASFALLPVFSGFTFDLPHQSIGFSPIVGGDFKCFWGTGTGWGDFIKKANGCKIVLLGGSLALQKITLGGVGNVKKVYADGVEIPFRQEGCNLWVAPIQVHKEIKIDCAGVSYA